MIPEALIRFDVSEGLLLPRYYTPRDHPWIRLLLDEYEAFAGRPRHELEARLGEPLPDCVPRERSRLILHLLRRMHTTRWRTRGVSPSRARAALFGAAAASPEPAERIREEVARSLDLSVGMLETSLFADLPRNRRITAPPDPLDPARVALEANMALVQGVLYRSHAVAIEFEGGARALVRLARMRGLMCTVRPGSSEGRATMQVWGPYSLFRRTLLYGRALAQLVPTLAWCRRFRLSSRCTIRKTDHRFLLMSGDPIFPGTEPRAFDSRLEERFDRDFRKVAPGYEIVREPEPVPVDGTLIFPDFAIRSQDAPHERWLVEIVGFWTPGYLERKLRLLREARLNRLILCVDEDRNCSDEDLPRGARIIPFRRRIDARAVLDAMEA